MEFVDCVFITQSCVCRANWGGFKAMHFQVEKGIQAPPDRVWHWLTDAERMREWMPELVATDHDGNASGQGATFVMTLREGGKLTTYEGEVTQWEPGRILGLKFTGGSLMKDQEMLVDYVLTNGGNRTLIKHAFAVETKGVWQFLEPIMEPLAKRPAVKHLSQLKTCVEAESAQKDRAGEKGVPA
jgi:carbon monoxide dehydrogenase subunit G